MVVEPLTKARIRMVSSTEHSGNLHQAFLSSFLSLYYLFLESETPLAYGYNAKTLQNPEPCSAFLAAFTYAAAGRASGLHYKPAK